MDSTFVDPYDIQRLPDSLLIEILARLPVKSIFKFKSVSKHWQTLISLPFFHRQFHSLISNASSLLPFRILYRYVYVSTFKDVSDRICHQNYNSSKFSVLFLSSFQEKQVRNQFKILGMSNGLILCGSLPRKYHVWDPVTRRCVDLPSGNSGHYFGEGFVSSVSEDNMVTSYKVVRFGLGGFSSNTLYVEVFSSETGKWVSYSLPCANSIQTMKRGGGPICFNGILHCFVDDRCMVAYDPYKDPKSCRMIKFPDDIDVDSWYNQDGMFRLCGECQGTLRYLEVASDCSKFYCFRMWVMKDYEKGEWCSEFEVTRFDLHSGDDELSSWLFKAAFLPLSFHPLDLNIVYLRCVELGCIVSYDIKNTRLDVACKPIGVDEDLTWRVVIPFVLPTWPKPFPVHPLPHNSWLRLRLRAAWRPFRMGFA